MSDIELHISRLLENPKSQVLVKTSINYLAANIQRAINNEKFFLLDYEKYGAKIIEMSNLSDEEKEEICLKFQNKGEGGTNIQLSYKPDQKPIDSTKEPENNINKKPPISETIQHFNSLNSENDIISPKTTDDTAKTQENTPPRRPPPQTLASNDDQNDKTKAMITSFEELINTRKISMQQESLDKIIHHFNCFLIQSNQIQIIKERKNESKIIIIDKINELDPYFIVIFDDTILFLSDISIIPNLISNFDESTIFHLSEEIMNLQLPKNIKDKLFQYNDSDKKFFLNLMNSFANHFLMKSNQNKIWMLVLPSLISFIIQKCNQKVAKKRFDTNIIKPKEFNENEFILLIFLYSSDDLDCRLAFHIETEEFFIAKSFKNSQTFQKEYENYNRIHHPFIPHFYGKSKILNKDYLIIEYINGQSLDKTPCYNLSNEDRNYIIIQLLIIFEYLHFNNFVYCNLTPKSLIIDQNKNLFLFNIDSIISLNESNTNCSVKTDDYSVGLLIYFLFSNNFPINKKENSEQLNSEQLNSEQLNSEQLNSLFNTLDQKYSHIKDICIECTETETKRPSITKLIDFICNYFFKQKYEITPNEIVNNINSDKIYPQWIQCSEYLQSFFKKKFEIANNEFIENYFQEINKIHLFFQIELGAKDYEEKYFKENIDKFIFHLTILVKENNCKSMFYLGLIYFEGEYVERSFDKGFYYLSLSANENYSKALEFLYSVFFKGKYFDIKSLKFDNFICYGNHGKVSSFINKQTKEIFIRKTFYVQLKDCSEKVRNKIMTDLSIGLQLNHPTICKYFSFYPFGIEDKQPVIFSEFSSNGSLFDVISKEKNNQKIIGWDSTTKIINVYGIAFGMMYLHSHNILHWNLNTKTILENEKFYPKINNYFIHKNFESLNSIAKIQSTSPFIAPEVYIKNEYTKESEVYSFGMIVYSIYSNEKQFSEMNQFEVSFENHNLDLDESVPQFIRQLVTNCWSMNQKDRPTFADIINALENNKETMSKIIDMEQFNEYIKFTKSCLVNSYEIKPFPEKSLKLFIKNKRKHKNEDENQNNKNNNKDQINKEEESKNNQNNKDEAEEYKNEEEEEEEEEEEYEIEEEEFIEFEEEEEEDFYYPFLKRNQVKSLKGLHQLELIDRGDFANIYKIYDKPNKRKYAAKVVKIVKMPEIENNPVKKEFIQEVICHSQANHETITKFIGYNQHYIHHIDNSVIFTEYLVNGSLNDILKKEREGEIIPFWDDTSKLICIYGIAISMSYLHSIGFIHCDLNPSNVLLDKYLFPKICDFGLSRKINDKNDQITFGTIGFIAPEICNDHNYQEPVDVYSFGMLLYVMLSKTDPFENMSYAFYINNYVKNCKRPEKNENIEDHYWNLIEKCWNADPTMRPTFSDIVHELSTNIIFTNSDRININLFTSYQNYIQNQVPLPHNFNKIYIKKSEKTH